MSIDDRKQRVLRAIVRLYSVGGEPVGSGLLAEDFGRAVSSATLRNEMKALEKLGLLEQPHTSAGRVPSAKGYRYYLDHLLAVPGQLPARERAAVDEAFREMDHDPERLAQSAARALSEWTGYTTVATTPYSRDLCIAHYEVMQVGRCTAAVLAVTNAGGVHTRTAKLDVALSAGDVAVLKQVLNETMTFRSAADMGPTQLKEAAQALGSQGGVLYPVISAAYKLLQEAGKARVFLEGEENFLRFTVPGAERSFRTLMEFFANPEAVRRTISPRTDRAAILLGDELEDYPLPGFCIMSKRYVAGGGLTGAIALVGPVRMPYGEMIPRLEYFALLLGQCMSGSQR